MKTRQSEERRRIAGGVVLCLLLTLTLPLQAQVVINEVMINEPGSEVVLEWVELFNTADTTVRLMNFQFEEGGQVTDFAETDTIPATGFAVLSRKPTGTPSFESTWGNNSGVWGDHPSEHYPLIEVTLSLKNSGDSVSLRNLLDNSYEVVAWQESPPDGVSWERINPYKPAIADNFADCRAESGSTPGAVNSVIPADQDLALVENSVALDLSHDGQPLLISGEIRNVGLLMTAPTYLAYWFDRDFDSELTPVDDLDSLILPALMPDSAYLFEIALTEETGRKSLCLTLPPDDDTTNNSAWSYFALGDFFTELRINEFLINPSDVLDCEWIELVSVVPYEFKLNGFALGDLERSYEITTSLTIEPFSRLILCEDSLNFVGYYGQPACALVEPESWGNYRNSGDIIVLRNDLGRFSDTVRYRQSWPDDVSWERDEDSVSGSFLHLFYRCTALSGSTPCAVNSERPLPPEHDLAFVQDSVSFEWLAESNELLVKAQVVNQGMLPTAAASVSIVLDHDLDGEPGVGDVSESINIPSLQPEESADVQLRLAEQPRRANLVLTLPEDDDNANNLWQEMIAIGDRFTELQITEFLVNPLPELDCEWIELQNVAEYPLEVFDFAVGDFESAYQFGDALPIGPGDRLVVCENRDNYLLYYGEPDCQLVQPTGWNNFSDLGDLIVVRNDFGLVSDSIRFSGSWPQNRSWERWEDSETTAFDSLFHPAVDSVVSTPCAANSIPTPPAQSDLAWLDACLETVLPSNPGDPLDIRACVINFGTDTTLLPWVLIYDDFNLNEAAEQEELLEEHTIGLAVAPGDTLDLGLRQHLIAGFHQLLLLLPEDEDSQNNTLVVPVSVGPLTHEIIVTEFLAAPADPLECEWLECRNNSSRDIDLHGWQVGDSLHQYTLAEHVVIEPGQYFILAQDSICFSSFYQPECEVIQPSGWSNLNNGGDRIVLLDDFGVVSDSVTYIEPPSDNRSLEMNEQLWNELDRREWYVSTAEDGATPCEANSVTGPEISETRVKLLNKVFSPHLGETLRYRISVPPATLMTIEIFDLAGRRHRTIAADKPFSSGDYEYAGESDLFGRLPVGAYIMLVTSDSYQERLSFAVAGPH